MRPEARAKTRSGWRRAFRLGPNNIRPWTSSSGAPISAPGRGAEDQAEDGSRRTRSLEPWPTPAGSCSTHPRPASRPSAAAGPASGVLARANSRPVDRANGAVAPGVGTNGKARGSDEPLAELIAGHSHGQRFFCPYDGLSGVRVQIGTFGRRNTCRLALHLRSNPGAGGDLRTLEVPTHV